MEGSPPRPVMPVPFKVATILFGIGVLAALFLGEWRYAVAGAVVWLVAMLVL